MTEEKLISEVVNNLTLMKLWYQQRILDSKTVVNRTEVLKILDIIF